MQINTNHRNGNLHIKVDGSFTQDTAAKLTMVMVRSYKGTGNIFIHTDRISNVDPASKCAFNDLITGSTLPEKNIYLMGENALAICHDAGKVIVRPKKKAHGHGGCGKCKNCSCGKKKAA